MGKVDNVAKETGKAVHEKSKASKNLQHGYEIFDDTGDVVKTGISGRPLNKKGTSPRANGQIRLPVMINILLEW